MYMFVLLNFVDFMVIFDLIMVKFYLFLCLFLTPY
jgi:hypothetical protein